MKLRLFSEYVDKINDRVGHLIAFLIIPITCITVLEVILRYAFNRPTIWAWETNIMLMGAFTIMVGGYVLLTGGHVIVDLFVGSLSPRARAIVDLITSLLFFFCIGLLVWQGGLAAWKSLLLREKNNTIWGPPIYPLKMLWPVGAFLLLLQGLTKFFRDLNTARSKRGKK